MPERCPVDHPHLYSFFKHENKFYRVGEGDLFEGPFFLIQSNSWLADSALISGRLIHSARFLLPAAQPSAKNG
jgi:hypothetical protein